MNNRIGIDFGTSNVRIYVKEKGVVLRAPSVIALNGGTDTVVAVGMKAWEMIGKTPGNIRAVCPVRGGVVADGDVAAILLNQLFRKVGAASMFSRPSVVITFPSGATPMERRAVEDAVYDAGAKSVTLLDAAVASALGANLRVEGARGSMIVDVGGGTTEAAVLSLGGVVASTCIRLAGNDFDRAISMYLRLHREILIGDTAAERLKVKAGAAIPNLRKEKLEVSGRDTATGLAKTIFVTSDEITRALEEPISNLCKSVKRALEDAPPELSGDIMSAGLVLTGGSSRLPGLTTRISEVCGVRVSVVEKPLDAAILGLGKLIENPERYEKLFRGTKR